MREKFEDKKDEPGMMTQLNKLDKLIDQLQQQESGYLGELIRLSVSSSPALPYRTVQLWYF